MQGTADSNMLFFISRCETQQSLAYEYTPEELETKTIGEVLSELAEDKIFKVVDYFDRPLPKDRTISYLLELQPYFIVKAHEKKNPDDEVSVNLKFPDLEVPMTLRVGSTVAELKKKIEEDGIPADDCVLRFQDDLLEDTDTLLEYGVGNDSTIEFVQELHGGGGAVFRAVDLDQTKKAELKKVDSNAPAWRVVKPGLNLEGICKGGNCKASGDTVIINKEFALYDVEADSSTNKCPCCKTTIELTNIGFHKCLFTYVGKRKEGGKSRGCNFQKVEDDYLLFDKEKCGEAKWESLKIITAALDKEPKTGSTQKKKSKCNHSTFDEKFSICNKQSKPVEIQCVECFLEVEV